MNREFRTKKTEFTFNLSGDEKAIKVNIKWYDHIKRPFWCLSITAFDSGRLIRKGMVCLSPELFIINKKKEPILKKNITVKIIWNKYNNNIINKRNKNNNKECKYNYNFSKNKDNIYILDKDNFNQQTKDIIDSLKPEYKRYYEKKLLLQKQYLIRREKTKRNMKCKLSNCIGYGKAHIICRLCKGTGYIQWEENSCHYDQTCHYLTCGLKGAIKGHYIGNCSNCKK